VALPEKGTTIFLAPLKKIILAAKPHFFNDQNS